MNRTQIPPEQLAILAKDNLGPMTAAISITFTVFAFICVLLRFFVRLTFKKVLGWEDYTIAVSMVFAIATAVCQVAQVKLGVGKHAIFVPLPSAINILKWLYASILTYCVSLTLTKISILLQYRRIFAVHETLIIVYVVMAFCIAYGIECVFSGTFTCVPVDAFWNVLKKPTAKCIDTNKLYYANASLNVFSDLVIAALPVRAIWRLQIEKKQKIALIILLSLGWFVCVVSILRVNAMALNANHPQDRTFYSVSAVYWSAIEMNLAIVCASAPALKPLAGKLIPAFSSRQSARESTNGSSARKGSKLSSHSFQRLGGKKSLSTMNSDVEHGFDATELNPVTPIAPAHHKQTAPGQIFVTGEAESQSHHRPGDCSSQHLVSEAWDRAYARR